MSCKTQTLFCLIFTCAAPLFAAPPPAPEFDYADPPQGLFVDEWMEMRLGEGKVGWSHTTFTRRGDEVHARSDSYMKMARGAIPIQVETSERTVESVDGQPHNFETHMKLSGQDIVTIGTVLDGKVSVTTKGPGYADTQEYAFPEGALMTWGLAQKTFEEGIEPGTEYSVMMYSPSMSAQQALPGTVSIGEPETFDYFGTAMRGPKVTTTLHAGPAEIVTNGWADENGRLLVTKMDMMGMPLTMVVVDQETALADFVPPEFFVSNLIQLKRAIPPDADEVTYALRLKSGDFNEALPPETKTQSVQFNDRSGVVRVKVRRAEHMELNTGVNLSLSGTFVPYMKANLVINSKDPAVIALAKKSPANKEESALEKAYALTHFVNRFIEEKHLGIGFATASEVAQDPQGDCSEHAVLLAALGRVEGIPSRVAAGLLYLPSYEGHKDIMGYHMWTQFHIGGQWLDFDATTDEQVAGPTRIALYYSSLQDESLAQLGLALIDTIGNLDVEVVEVKTEATEEQ